MVKKSFRRAFKTRSEALKDGLVFSWLMASTGMKNFSPVALQIRSDSKLKPPALS